MISARTIRLGAVAFCLLFWAALLAGCFAMAQRSAVQLPPLRYQQGEGVVVVQVTRDPNALCASLGAPRNSIACYDGLRIVMADPCLPRFRGQELADIFCHELGHHFGWPEDHPL